MFGCSPFLPPADLLCWIHIGDEARQVNLLEVIWEDACFPETDLCDFRLSNLFKRPPKRSREGLLSHLRKSFFMKTLKVLVVGGATASRQSSPVSHSDTASTGGSISPRPLGNNFRRNSGCFLACQRCLQSRQLRHFLPHAFVPGLPSRDRHLCQGDR